VTLAGSNDEFLVLTLGSKAVIPTLSDVFFVLRLDVISIHHADKEYFHPHCGHPSRCELGNAYCFMHF